MAVPVAVPVAMTERVPVAVPVAMAEGVSVPVAIAVAVAEAIAMPVPVVNGLDHLSGRGGLSWRGELGGAVPVALATAVAVPLAVPVALTTAIALALPTARVPALGGARSSAAVRLRKLSRGALPVGSLTLRTALLTLAISVPMAERSRHNESDPAERHQQRQGADQLP